MDMEGPQMQRSIVSSVYFPTIQRSVPPNLQVVQGSAVYSFAQHIQYFLMLTIRDSFLLLCVDSLSLYNILSCEFVNLLFLLLGFCLEGSQNLMLKNFCASYFLPQSNRKWGKSVCTGTIGHQ